MLQIAEDLSLKKSQTTADIVAAYDLAIETMASDKLPHAEALANERAAFYQVKCKNQYAAETYFERALQLYAYEWGATAKHDYLVEVMEKTLMKMTKASVGVMDSQTVPRILNHGVI